MSLCYNPTYMHIPDSAISPATSLAAVAAMLPAWLAAGRRLRFGLGDRQVPLLAIGAAFCFTIMMFNIPVPGGTTVHPTGAVLLAVLLGPAAAIIGMTVALAIQALFFGDGGVLALGANAFTMAFAMPVCGYLVYRAVAGRSPQNSPRRSLAAGIGAYVGLNIAALLTAVLLGIQPALYHAADGRALFFPFGLKVAIPAILTAHLLIAGIAEAVITVAAVRYINAIGISMYDSGADSSDLRYRGRGRMELLWVALGALAALSPLGILAQGGAWGEWGATELQERAGYIPAGLSRVEEHGWKGFNLLPGYLSDHGKWAYAGAALIGIVLVTVCIVTVGRLLRRGGDSGNTVSGFGEPPEETRVEPGDIPAWMLAAEDDSIAGVTETGRGADFVERTLAGIADAARESVVAERWARRDGLLQHLDARVKIVGLCGLILLTAFLHRPAALVSLYAVALLLARFSRVPLGLMIRRVWLAVPLFVGMVTFPAVLNIVTPGRPLVVIFREPFLAVTDAGLYTALLLTFRVAVAVTFATLLALTTRWDDLLRGLRVLFVPKVFLVIVAMTYRYLAVLLQSASEMFTARKSRTLGRTARRESRRFVGGAIGALFGKTVTLTEDVYAAMLSRGWSGEARLLEPVRLRAADAVWLVAMAGVAAAAIAGEILA